MKFPITIILFLFLFSHLFISAVRPILALCWEWNLSKKSLRYQWVSPIVALCSFFQWDTGVYWRPCFGDLVSSIILTLSRGRPKRKLIDMSGSSFLFRKFHLPADGPWATGLILIYMKQWWWSKKNISIGFLDIEWIRNMNIINILKYLSKNFFHLQIELNPDNSMQCPVINSPWARLYD